VSSRAPSSYLGHEREKRAVRERERKRAREREKRAARERAVREREESGEGEPCEREGVSGAVSHRRMP